MSNKWLKKTLIILIFLILVCIGYVLWLIYGYYKSDHEYQMICEDYVMPDDDLDMDVSDKNLNTDNLDDTNDYVSPIPYRDIDIDGLIARNPDFVCWLYYGDGGVDYPVVKEHEDDINRYLHRTFDGASSSAGCIFMPYDASSDFSDLNTFLYGHNMKNGSMFGSLKKIFRNPSENFKDPYFYMWTKDYECIMYRVVSMYVVDKDSNMFGVPTGESAYDAYLKSVLNAGSIDALIPFTEDEKQAMDNTSPIVTFSVCYGAAGTRNRLLVHGVEVFREEYVR